MRSASARTASTEPQSPPLLTSGPWQLEGRGRSRQWGSPTAPVRGVGRAIADAPPHTQSGTVRRLRRVQALQPLTCGRHVKVYILATYMFGGYGDSLFEFGAWTYGDWLLKLMWNDSAKRNSIFLDNVCRNKAGKPAFSNTHSIVRMCVSRSLDGQSTNLRTSLLSGILNQDIRIQSPASNYVRLATHSSSVICCVFGYYGAWMLMQYCQM